ncbi:MAG: peptide/nickel transport system permease protein [Actinomycetota bacterium]|jgi:peptide/nickel transport system permease protein
MTMPREALDVQQDAPDPGAAIQLRSGEEGVARSQWKLFWRRFLQHRMAIVAAAVLALIIFACFGADWVAPYTKNKQDLLIGPAGPSGKHWFGTDELGRDQLTELLYAGQISLKIGLAVALIATVVGTVLGAVAGYFGRWADQLLMRLTDLFLVVPAVAILAIAIKKLGNNSVTIVYVLAALGWMYIARVVRSQVLSIKEKEFIEAARASGATHARIIVRHLLPNTIGPILVNATLAIAAAIITESTLSFLGFGVQPPTTSWGRMLSDSRGYVGTPKAYLIYFPGLALLLVVLSVNFIGDALRDAFDPQSRR